MDSSGLYADSRARGERGRTLDGRSGSQRHLARHATIGLGLLIVWLAYADPPRFAGRMANAPADEAVPAAPAAEGAARVWSGGASGAISLGFDDNRPDHWSLAAPEMTARGLRGTFHVNPAMGQFVLWRDHYIEMADAGHELAGHTATHRYCIIVPLAEDPDNLYFHSIEELDSDCRFTKTALEALMHRACVTVAYPGGQYSSQTLPVLMSHFLAGRTSTPGPLTNDPTPADPGHLVATRVGDVANSPVWGDYQYTRDHLTSFLNLAEQSGKWVIYEHHDVRWPGYSGVNVQAWVDHLDELADAQDQRRVWVAPEGDVIRYIFERDAAQTTIVPRVRRYDVSVEDGLDDRVFDVPLTVLVTIAADGIQDVTVSRGGTRVEFELSHADGLTFIQFEALPNGGITRIEY